MKKLIGLFALVLVFSLVSAEEWSHIVTDNIVNDICLAGDEIYLATNGGVEIFDGQDWIIHSRPDPLIKDNQVQAIVVNDQGDLWFMGSGWLTIAKDHVHEVHEAYIGWSADLAIGPEGRVYAATGEAVYDIVLDDVLPVFLPQNHDAANRIAVDSYGSLWGVSQAGISKEYQYHGMTAHKYWKADELAFGFPHNIASFGDIVLCPAMKGFYWKFILEGDDWHEVKWPEGFFLSIQVPCTIFQGLFVFGYGGSIYLYDPEDSSWAGPFSHEAFSEVRCLAADEENLYIGTDNKMWVCEGGDIIGQTFTQMSATGIRWAHSNNIRHIAPDNTGRILVGTYEGGYRYDVSENPGFNSSQENVKGPVLASFVDNKGAEWVWANTELTRNGEQVNVPVSATGLHYPFWLLEGPASSASNLWLLTSDPVHRLQVYAGEGTWANKVDQPSGLAEENILSASSIGQRMYIGTEEAIYAYDFKGNWSYKKLHKTNVRFVATGDITGGVWVADGGYSDDEYNVKYFNFENPTFSSPTSWPYKDICPTGIYLDEDKVVWVSTFQGAYYLDREESANWQAVPLDKLTDDVVRTIYVRKTDSGKQVWFGTAGGLTIWNKDSDQTTSIRRQSMPKTNLIPSRQKAKGYDLLGRRMKVFPNRMTNMPAGMRIIQDGTQAVKRLHIER